ncbi:MAG: helix-turn-helix domain-containing protein [Brevinema sp.]
MQFILWVLLLVTGSYLLIGKVPEENTFDIYRKSRRIAGGAFLVYCIQFFLQWRFDLRDNFPEIATANNITLFYLGSILLGFSFIFLLSEKSLRNTFFIISLIVWAIVCSIVWASIFFLPQEITKWVLYMGMICRFGYTTTLLIKLIKLYKKAVIKIRNYHSDNVDIFIKWMSKSLFYGLGVGLSTTILLSINPQSKWTVTLLLGMAILLFYYIFMNLIDYLIHFNTIESAIEEKPQLYCSEQSIKNSIEPLDLEEKVLQWIQIRGYTRPKINMEELAKELGSNRTYLSGFINSHYECSYYEWIARLRIEEAKNILRENPELTITQISERVGFSSNSHFTRLFTEKENLSPAKWRQRYL